MAVRIDQARQEGAAVSVDNVRIRMTLPEHRRIAGLDHFAPVEHQLVEAVELVAGESVAVYVLNQCRSTAGRDRRKTET